jgi:Zinc-finger of the MIZ type in Nse subunit/Pentapeptide repeats (8 copies)
MKRSNYTSITGEQIILPKWTTYSRVKLDAEIWTPLLTCPITQEFFRDPVTVSKTGHTYERDAILEWIAGNETDPNTGVELGDSVLIPNGLLLTIAQRIECEEIGGEEVLFFYCFRCVPRMAALQSLAQRGGRRPVGDDHYSPYKIGRVGNSASGAAAVNLFSGGGGSLTEDRYVDLSCEFLSFTSLTPNARIYLEEWRAAGQRAKIDWPIVLAQLVDARDRDLLGLVEAERAMCDSDSVEKTLLLVGLRDLLICPVTCRWLRNPVLVPSGCTIDESTNLSFVEWERVVRGYHCDWRNLYNFVEEGQCCPNWVIKKILAAVGESAPHDPATTPAVIAFGGWCKPDLDAEYLRRVCLFKHAGELEFIDRSTIKIMDYIRVVEQKRKQIEKSAAMIRVREKISAEARVELVRGDLNAVGSRGDLNAVGSRGDLNAVGSRGDLNAVGSRGDLNAVGSRGGKSRRWDNSCRLFGMRQLHGFPGILSALGRVVGVDYSFTDLTRVVVKDKRFADSCFDGCDLQKGKFVRCDLRECTFIGANLRKCEFKNCQVDAGRLAGTGAILS